MITKIIAEEQIQQARKYMNRVEKIVIVTHVFPDGDAIGSSLGLYHFLLEEDKQVNVIVPNDFPDFLKWMKGAGDIIIYEKNPDLAAETITSAELIFCLDFNLLKRTGAMAPLVEQSAALKVMMDHHLDPDHFCHVTMSYPQFSSTSEMIFRLICRMGFFDSINRSCAECIYTGMMTDTGAFTYNSNHAEMYFIVGELLKKGIDKDIIYTRVYNTNSLSRLRLMGYVLYKKMKFYHNKKVVLVALSKDEMLHFFCQKGDTEGLVNLPLSMEQVVLSVLIREDTDIIKISFRSKGTLTCNQMATDLFGGGGHPNAAGGEFSGTLDEAVEVFEKGFQRYL